MRKRIVGVLAFGAVVAAGLFVLFSHRTPDIFLFSANCVVIDAETGRHLYEKKPGERREPASMTKLAALILFFEALEDGRLHTGDLVPVSPNAVSTIASKAGLRAGEGQTVETMLDCIFLPSGSDAVIALGEHLFGDERALLAAMNEKVSALGLADTQFLNCVGLSQQGHYSTAADIALLSRELITKHPEALAYSAKTASVLRHRDGTQSILRNTNKLLDLPGVDGLKTGHTSEAGYCQSVTFRGAKGRYIFVIMGAQSETERGSDAETLIGAFS